MKNFIIDTQAMIADEVCSHCARQEKLWQCRRTTCPYQNFFEELAMKCEDIDRDANYLLDLAAEEDEEFNFDYPHDNYNPFEDYELFLKRIRGESA